MQRPAPRDHIVRSSVNLPRGMLESADADADDDDDDVARMDC